MIPPDRVEILSIRGATRCKNPKPEPYSRVSTDVQTLDYPRGTPSNSQSMSRFRSPRRSAISLAPVEKSRELVDKVEDLGLQPFEAPDPLPPIEEDEVKLVCWMVVAPEEEQQEQDEGQS